MYHTGDVWHKRNRRQKNLPHQLPLLTEKVVAIGKDSLVIKLFTVNFLIINNQHDLQNNL